MLRPLPLLSCLLPALAIAGAAAGANKTNRIGIEKDLKLQVRVTGSRVVRPQEPIQLEIKLVNTSRSRSHHVVKPGDGSEVGWREPHVYYSAEAKAKDGRWNPLPRRSMPRCGMYDPDWHKDVVKLRPGKSLSLREWLPAPERGIEYQRPGPIRLYIHYKYTQGRAAKSRNAGVSGKTGKMGHAPPFHLVSKPVQLRVIRPLDLRLKINKKRLAAGWNHRLSKILVVTLTNRSGKKLTVPPPTQSGGARVRIELEGNRGLPPRIDHPAGKNTAMALRPGQTAPVLGKGALARGLDGHWSYPKAGKVRIRAVYVLTRKPQGQIASEWVEIEFFKR